jgi:transposase
MGMIIVPIHISTFTSDVGHRKRIFCEIDTQAIADELSTNQFNAGVAKHFLRAVQHEFGKKLVIVLDNASYFIAKTLKKQAVCGGLLLEFLPSHSPEPNSLESCWRQLRDGRANRLFLTLDDVKEYLSTALPALNLSQTCEYLC